MFLTYCLSVVLWLDKEDFPEICILCVHDKINKRSFEPFCVWILTCGLNSLGTSPDLFVSLAHLMRPWILMTNMNYASFMLSRLTCGKHSWGGEGIPFALVVWDQAALISRSTAALANQETKTTLESSHAGIDSHNKPTMTNNRRKSSRLVHRTTYGPCIYSHTFMSWWELPEAIHVFITLFMWCLWSANIINSPRLLIWHGQCCYEKRCY